MGLKWSEYKIVMKNAGLSWLGHLLPFGIIVAYQMQFGSDQVKFRDEYCQCSRFGNSGLFLVFSKEVQEKLYADRRKNEEWRRQEKEEEEKAKLEELQKKYSQNHGGKNNG